MTEYTVIFKALADSTDGAIEAVYQRLEDGGEPDAVLSFPVSFPDPEIDGEQVTL